MARFERLEKIEKCVNFCDKTRIESAKEVKLPYCQLESHLGAYKHIRTDEIANERIRRLEMSIGVASNSKNFNKCPFYQELMSEAESKLARLKKSK